MTTITETTFRINTTSKLTSFISGKTFRNDKDFLNSLEDFLFGKIIETSDIGDYVEEPEILRTLNKNIGK